jgi:uncharacterized protein YcbX
MPTLARINIHPVKSLDLQSVDEAVLLASGALQHDRRFAMRDRQGQFLTAKSTPAMHRLRSHFDLANERLSLRIEGTSDASAFDVHSQRRQLADWLSDFFSMRLDFVEDPLAGFPDDTDAPGPTVIGVATLTEVGAWFAGLTTDEVRRRFRANLEIEGVEPFWEDRLVADEGRVVRFEIGEAELWGTNPCQRCPVPTRNPDTGDVICGFAKLFSARRQQSLPNWAAASRFDHFYRLAVNTRRSGSQECTLRVGDEVRVLGIA